MMDQKGRLFGKISIVDIVIVLAVLVAVAGFAYKMNSGNSTIAVKADTPVTMVLRMEQVRQFTVDAVRVGDQVYEEHGDLLGTIVSYETKPAYRTGENGDGTVTYAPVENRYNLYITLEGVARVSDTGIFLNGSKQFSKGGNVRVESPTLSSNAYIDQLTAKQ
ncbi:MAG: DUF4330 domain-containing protein [Eubacteriales bacterium]|jgi:hypothetical protein